MHEPGRSGGAERSCHGGSSRDQNATLRERAKITFEDPRALSLAKARPTTCATTTVLRLPSASPQSIHRFPLFPSLLRFLNDTSQISPKITTF